MSFKVQLVKWFRIQETTIENGVDEKNFESLKHFLLVLFELFKLLLKIIKILNYTLYYSDNWM